MSELSQEARDLIESTIHADDPADADRARLRARLAAQLGAAAVASTLGAAHSTMASARAGVAGTSAGSLSAPAGGLLKGVGSFSGLFKVAVVTGLAGVIGGPVAWFSQQPELGAQRMGARANSPVAASASPASTPVVETLAPTVAAEVPDSHHGASAVEVLDDLGSPRRERVTSRRESRAQARLPESTLSDELSLLAQAQQALRDGAPALALSHAAQHRERFPRGSLREERFGIEALARCAMGHDASEVVAALARLSPSSPLLGRVRTACGSPQ